MPQQLYNIRLTNSNCGDRIANNQDMDTIFAVLENPIRRKILEKLAEESHYPLQLSKELNISQQAIMKHLKVLEDNGLVVSSEQKSTLGGPPRKSYISNKRITLRIDVGPNTYHSEIFDYKELEDKKIKDVMNKERTDIVVKYREDFKEKYSLKDPNEKLKEYSTIIQSINKELEGIKHQRAKLISLRENIIRESNRIIVEYCNEYDERKILYYLLTHQNRDLDTISEVMEMRKKVIEEIFRKLMRQQLFFSDFDEF
jgi:predicted transcriptional regulator